MAEPVAFSPDGTPIDERDLGKAIASGQARFATGQTVHFVDPAGNRYSVDGKDAWAEIQRGGQVIAPSQHRHYEEVKQAGESPVEAAKTVGTGVARTLTFGLSDPALAAIDPEYQHREQIRQEAMPALKEASELAGYALPIAGELGLGGRALKAVTAAPRALSAAARGTAEAATAGLGKSAAKRVLGGAIEGGIEGAGFGVQQGISQQAIHDEPLTWQRIALDSSLGAGLGGLLGGLGSIGKKAGAIERAEPRLLEGKPSLLEPAPEVAALGAGKPSLLDSTQQKIADASVGMEMRGAGYRGSDIAKFTREGGPETVERYARRIRNEAGVTGGDSLKDIYEKQLEQKAAAGAEFSTISRTLEDAGFRVDANKALAEIDENVLKPLRESSVADTRRLADRLDDGILSDLRAQVTGESRQVATLRKSAVRDIVTQERERLFSEAQSALDYVPSKAGDRQILRGIDEQLRARADEFRDAATAQLRESGIGVPKTEFTFDEWRNIRREIDKKIDLSKARGELTEKGKVIRSIRDQMEKSLSQQVAEGVEKPLADAYSAAKLRYKDWATLADSLNHRLGVTEGNRFVSSTDTVAAAGGAATLGAPGAIVGALLNKTIRSPQASRIGAEIANKVAGKHAVLDAATAVRAAETSSGRLGQRLSEAIGKTSFALPSMTNAAAYQVKISTSKGAANLLEFADRVQREKDRIDDPGSQLAALDALPGVQREAALTRAQAVQLVADLAPHAAQPLNPVLGDNQPPPPESLAHEYADIVRMLDQPQTVFEKFENGTLTRKQAGVLQSLLPRAFEDIQKNALAAVGEQVDRGRTPNYQSRLRLAVLTGVPIDPSDTPQFRNAVRGIYQKLGAQAQQQARAKPRGGDSISSRRKTETERIEEA